MNKEIKTVIFILALSTICALILGGANLLYRKAESIFNERLFVAILELYGIDTTGEEIESLFSRHFTTEKQGGNSWYIAKEVNPGSIVVKAEGPGLWSILEILVALNADRQTLLGIKVVAQAETPGLGARVSEEDFQRLFTGAEVRPEIYLVKFATASNQIDSLSGATITSLSVQNIVNKAVEEIDRHFPVDSANSGNPADAADSATRSGGE